MLAAKWTQNAINCAIRNINGENIEKQIEQLALVYDTFDNENRRIINKIIETNMEINDGIFIFSFLKNYIKSEDIWDGLINLILQGKFDWKTAVMLEVQVRLHGKSDYSVFRKLHQKSLSCIEKDISCDYKWIPKKERNSKNLIIFTEQLGRLQHSPTHIVLEFCYILQEKLGYNVKVITCTSNMALPPQLWVYTQGFYGRKEKKFIYEYRGTKLSVYNYAMNNTTNEEYCEMYKEIYDWKPYFCLNLGVINPIADIPKKFTDIATLGMTINCPVSEAQILLREKKRSDKLEKEYSAELKAYQKQIFIEKSMPPIIIRDGIRLTREELGLPNDKFIIAIVGNRLDTEVDDTFINVIKNILYDNSNVVFAFIGKVKKIKKYLENEAIDNRVFYMGYCENLIGVYAAIDLYLNPPRIGGGFSAAMALEAGIPVVTLPDCDVSYYTGEPFCVSGTEEMQYVINKYIEDNMFYLSQQKKIKDMIHESVNDDIYDYVVSLVKKIENLI